MTKESPPTVLWNCQSIRPGESGGVENFVYGLLTGIASIEDTSRHVVAVLPGTESTWGVSTPQDARIEIRPIVASGSALGRALGSARLREAIRWARRRAPRIMTSEPISRIERALRAVRSGDGRFDVSYFPFHRGNEPRAERSVVTVHDLRVFQPGHMDEKQQTVVRRTIVSARAVVASWPHPYQQLLELFPEERSKIFLVPLPPLLIPTGKKRSVEQQARPFLLYPASTAPHKNHARLIDAFAPLTRDLDVDLVCTGPLVEPHASRAKDRARELGVDERVQFRGFVSAETLEDLLARAAVVVCPTLWEAASGPVFEALVRRRPIAASRIAPIVSQLEFCGGNAFLFDPTDVGDIERAMRESLGDPDRYAAANEAAARFLAGLTWGRTAEAYVRIFRWVHEGSPADARPDV